MAPPLIVRAILDTVQYFKAAEGVNTANAGMGATALAMGSDFTKSSSQVVAAGVTVAESLQRQVAEYGQLAAAAKAGSIEQQIAAAQGAKAQLGLNRMLGTSAVATSKVSQEAKKGERDLGKLTRGALAGSAVFSKLGRSLAFASTGFIAVAGGATVIAESIRQAEGLAAAQRQVDRQLQTSGKSWDQYGNRIDSALLKEGHLAGFTRSQLLQAFGYLLRVGGNVQRSLNLTGLAADVARGRSISLQAASIALSKALGGSATALRRLGIIVPKNVTTMQALEYVQKKFAGQAAAGTTQSQRLGASLADAGATIGTVLLPTFDRLAAKGSNWLTKMQQSGQLTKDFASVTTLLGHGLHALGDAIGTVDKITGSFGHTLLVIGEIWGAIKITSWISTLGALAVEWGLVASAAEKAAAAEAAAAAVSSAGIATGDLRAAGIGAQAAGGAGLLGRLRGTTLAGRAGIGAGLAIGGQLLGPQIGGLIGGQAGKTTSSAIQFAGLGAGLGLLAGPEGAAAGAAVGALAGGLMTLIHTGPSLQSSLEGDASSMKTLGAAAHDAALAVTNARLQRLQLQDTLAGQRQAVSSARGAVARTDPGTAARADAVRKLTEAELVLRQTEQQLKVTTDSLTKAEQKQAEVRKARQKVAADETNKVLKLAASYASLEKSLSKGSVTSSSDISTLMQSVKDGTDKSTSAVGSFEIKLAELASKSTPHLQKILNLIRDLTIALGHVPNATEIKLIFSGQGNFKLGPGGDLFPTGPRSVPGGPKGGAGPTGPAPVVQWTQFQLTLTEQILQAKAALTKTTADDVAVAKQIIARIKSLIDRGKLSDKALLQALQAEASAQSVITSAEDARKAAAQQAAAAAKARASTYAIPGFLQLAQAKAEAYGKSETGILKKIIAAAQHAISAGGKNWQGLVAAYQVIAQARSQLEQDAQAAIIPLKLQLALAKAQATGGNQTPILKKMKAALEKALKAAHGNIQKQIDIWNQIAQINQQLGTNVNNAYGDYKKASLKWETQGLGLSRAQREALQARLSQLGPGGTHPMSGTGAAGFIIDPDTGRPIQRTHRRRGSQYSGSGGGRPPTVNANIDLNVYIDGHHVEATVTKRQQRNNQRRPVQRRGPNAATR